MEVYPAMLRGLTEEQAEQAGMEAMSNYMAGWQKPTPDTLALLIAEQQRTNALLALQTELLISLLHAANDGWCDTSSERNQLERIMGES